jgi:predicted GIY-YIG superfamily endonuclease
MSSSLLCSVYVLALEGGRYYVGRTKDISSRYEQHLNGNGSFWTKKYKPIALEKTFENVSVFEEDKVTKEYMDKYGIDMVRGGSYVQIELSEIQKRTLTSEIWSAKDLCNRCGRSSHFVKNCYAKTDISGNRLTKTDEGKVEEIEEEKGEKNSAVKEEKTNGESFWGWASSLCSRFLEKPKYSFDSPSSSNLLEIR